MEHTVRDPEPVVAIGLLTARDLDLLGAGFRRAWPIDDDPAFEDLLRAIDRAERQRRPPPGPESD